MPQYDICCIAGARATTEQITTLVRRVAHELEKRGGALRKVEHYGIRPLAYPIRAHSKRHEVGRYFRIHVQTSPVTADLIAQRIGTDESIIRYRAFAAPTLNKPAGADAAAAMAHEAPISAGHYDALRRTSNVDYFLARTLLKLGKITPQEVLAAGTHSPIMTPASTTTAATSSALDTMAVPTLVPQVYDAEAVAAAGPVAQQLFAETVDALSVKAEGFARPAHAEALAENDPVRAALARLSAGSVSVVAAGSAPAAGGMLEEARQARAASSVEVLEMLAGRVEVAADTAAMAQRSEANMARAKQHAAATPQGYNPHADIAKVRGL